VTAGPPLERSASREERERRHTDRFRCGGDEQQLATDAEPAEHRFDRARARRGGHDHARTTHARERRRRILGNGIDVRGSPQLLGERALVGVARDRDRAKAELRQELDGEVPEPAEPLNGDQITGARRAVPQRVERRDAGAEERRKVFPATSPLVAKRGDRVRIRLGNLGAMDHHPIHLHGYQFRIAATDGGRIPEAGQWPETTVLVPVGSTRDIEFVADQPGDWAFHCHMTHHTMNQMGHRVPIMLGVKTDDLDAKVRQLLPDYMTMGNTGMGDMAAMGMAAPRNSIPMVGGRGPFGTIDMGGMFTVFKVRDGITSYDDPGWYDNPHGTVAELAKPDELRADGIKS